MREKNSHRAHAGHQPGKIDRPPQGVTDEQGPFGFCYPLPSRHQPAVTPTFVRTESPTMSARDLSTSDRAVQLYQRGTILRGSTSPSRSWLPSPERQPHGPSFRTEV